MTDAISQYDADHCSRWSGIPQDKLIDRSRRHIEMIVKAWRTRVYNLPINWQKAEFTPGYTVIAIRSSMASFDFDQMTRLVILAHDYCVRVKVSARTIGYLELMFHDRRRWPPELPNRHPTIEAAIEAVRKAAP